MPSFWPTDTTVPISNPWEELGLKRGANPGEVLIAHSVRCALLVKESMPIAGSLLVEGGTDTSEWDHALAVRRRLDLARDLARDLHQWALYKREHGIRVRVDKLAAAEMYADFQLPPDPNERAVRRTAYFRKNNVRLPQPSFPSRQELEERALKERERKEVERKGRELKAEDVELAFEVQELKARKVELNLKVRKHIEEMMEHRRKERRLWKEQVLEERNSRSRN